MLKEAMLAIRVTDMEYAPDIKRLLIAGKRDLEIAGVIIQGEINITITEDQETGAITATDSSTITDDLVLTAIFTYVGARGNYAGTDERAKLEDSYVLQRKQLANATGYTDFLEPEPDPEPQVEPDPEYEPEPDPEYEPEPDPEGAEE
jgi:hypothetical protein